MLVRIPLPRSPCLRPWGAMILLAGLPALASAEPVKDRTTAEPLVIQSRTDKPDGSAALTIGRRLDTEWDVKMGLDVGLAAPLTTTPPPTTALDGWSRQDRSTGTGWASVALPAPLGWEKAAVEARVDPGQEQGKIATTLSRSMPIGDAGRLTVRNGYSVTGTLANPGGTSAAGHPSQTLTTEGGVSFDLLSTATTFTAGRTYSTADDKWLTTLSAEQKVFGGPISVTGAISERPSGETDRSIKAGFKAAW